MVIEQCHRKNEFDLGLVSFLHDDRFLTLYYALSFSFFFFFFFSVNPVMNFTYRRKSEYLSIIFQEWTDTRTSSNLKYTSVKI